MMRMKSADKAGELPCRLSFLCFLSWLRCVVVVLVKRFARSGSMCGGPMETNSNGSLLEEVSGGGDDLENRGQ